MKKTVLFIAITLFTLNGFAQGFGINAAYNMAKMKLAYDGAEEGIQYKKSLGSIGFSINYDYEISENLFISSGINYIQKGVRYFVKDNGDTWDFKMKMNYLDIPILIKYNFEIGDETYLYGKFGPSLGITLGGKAIDKSIYENGSEDVDKYDLKFGSDKYKNDYKSGDFGLNFGAGVIYNNIEIGINYYSGMKNLGLFEKQDYKHKVFSLVVGYRFNLE